MKQIRYAAFAVLLLFAGCSSLSLSPEAQIKGGADSVSASAVVGGVLLKNSKITPVQARSYLTILQTAGKHLDDAGAALAACRTRTGSTQATTPDPCRATVIDDINLGISIAEDVKRTLDKK